MDGPCLDRCPPPLLLLPRQPRQLPPMPLPQLLLRASPPAPSQRRARRSTCPRRPGWRRPTLSAAFAAAARARQGQSCLSQARLQRVWLAHLPGQHQRMSSAAFGAAARVPQSRKSGRASHLGALRGLHPQRSRSLHRSVPSAGAKRPQRCPRRCSRRCCRSSSWTWRRRCVREVGQAAASAPGARRGSSRHLCQRRSRRQQPQWARAAQGSGRRARSQRLSVVLPNRQPRIS